MTWSDGVSRSPVAVVSKMHYFEKLDVDRTVRDFARSCPSFWASADFRDILEGSNILALDISFFAQVMLYLWM